MSLVEVMIRVLAQDDGLDCAERRVSRPVCGVSRKARLGSFIVSYQL